MTKTLLIVHHTPSPHCQEMFEAVVSGATDPEIEGVEVVRRPALTVSPVEMLEADGYLLGTPGQPRLHERRLKHAFDVCYYQCLDATVGDPSASTSTATRAPREPSGSRGHHDRAGLGEAAETVVVMGKPTKADVEACWNLGATVAAVDGRVSPLGATIAAQLMEG